MKYKNQIPAFITNTPIEFILCWSCLFFYEHIFFKYKYLSIYKSYVFMVAMAAKSFIGMYHVNFR